MSQPAPKKLAWWQGLRLVLPCFWKPCLPARLPAHPWTRLGRLPRLLFLANWLISGCIFPHRCWGHHWLFWVVSEWKKKSVVRCLQFFVKHQVANVWSADFILNYWCCFHVGAAHTRPLHESPFVICCAKAIGFCDLSRLFGMAIWDLIQTKCINS